MEYFETNGTVVSSISNYQEYDTDSLRQEFQSILTEVREYKFPFMNKDQWENIKKTLELISQGKYTLENTLEWIRSNNLDDSENLQFSAHKMVKFFTSHNYEEIFPKLAQLVLESPKLFNPNPITILKQGSRDSVILSEKQCACLLAHMFFCLTIRQNNVKLSKLTNFFPLLTCNPLQAKKLFSSKNQKKEETKNDENKKRLTSQKKEKLKGLFIYFKTFFDTNQENERCITFTRLGPSEESPLPDWTNVSDSLTDFSIRSGKIEEVSDAVEVSFSDEELGATDLLIGATQQPIKFFMHPELILGVLFCEIIKDDEALLIKGVKQFSVFTGYSSTFMMEKEDPNETLSSEEKEILLLDPIDFIKISEEEKDVWKKEEKINNALNDFNLNSFEENKLTAMKKEDQKRKVQQYLYQYQKDKVLRELNKYYVGFSADDIKEKISSGSGGCGIYGGNPQLKFLMQWIAASVTKKELAYNVRETLDVYFGLIEEIKNKFSGMNANELFKQVLECCKRIENDNRKMTDLELERKEINNSLFKLLLEK